MRTLNSTGISEGELLIFLDADGTSEFSIHADPGGKLTGASVSYLISPDRKYAFAFDPGKQSRAAAADEFRKWLQDKKEE